MKLTKGYNPILPPPRNSQMGLAYRAVKNLENIKCTYEAEADVHVVTQAIISLQAILVFPWESIRNGKVSVIVSISVF
jgi:hypothetical protein